MDYKEQIKSPLWQKRRLEILNRDNFTCQICGCKDKTLHVHHLVYEKGKMIWEYPDKLLITLCEECHEHEHICEETLKDSIWYLRLRGVTYKEILDLLQYMDYQMYKGNQHVIEDVIGENNTPEINVPYIRLLAQRRESCSDKF